MLHGFVVCVYAHNMPLCSGLVSVGIEFLNLRQPGRWLSGTPPPATPSQDRIKDQLDVNINMIHSLIVEI